MQLIGEAVSGAMRQANYIGHAQFLQSMTLRKRGLSYWTRPSNADVTQRRF